MAFLRFTEAAREKVRTFVPSLGQDVAKRVLERSFRIALARDARQIELADIQAALTEVEPRP